MLDMRKRNALIVLSIVSAIAWVGCSRFHKFDRGLIADLEKNVGACRDQSQKAQVICRGLRWLLEHPADIKDPQGFLEMGGELHIFYQFYVRSNNSREKNFFKGLITSRIRYLLNKHDFKVNYAGEITAYLIFAKVMKKLGIHSSRYRHFIDKEIVNNDKTYPLNVNINATIFISGLIDGIGDKPKIPFRDILRWGVIARYSSSPDLIPCGKPHVLSRYKMEFYYMITHEIFAMANFGDRDPRHFLGKKELQFLKNIIPFGISTSMEWGEVDILAELIICARMLGYTDFEGLEEGVQYLLDFQKEDGAFGPSIRAADLGRTDSYRHVVVMALWALLE